MSVIMATFPGGALGPSAKASWLFTGAYIQAHLVDRDRLREAQEKGDAMVALQTLKQAFTMDVAPIIASARQRAGGAIDPLATYRASSYRQRKAEERPAAIGISAGIV